jgi:hypothetical protein
MMVYPGEVDWRTCSAEIRVAAPTLDFRLIEGALALQSTLVIRRGQVFSKAMGPSAVDEWVYRAPVSDRVPLAEHVQAIVTSLEMRAEGLRSVREKYEVRFIARWSSDNAQGHIELPAGLLVRLGQLGLTFELALLSFGGVVDKGELDAPMV